MTISTKIPALRPLALRRLGAIIATAVLSLLFPGQGGTAMAQGAGPAQISIRRADGEPLGSIELGDRVEFEVVIDAGSAQLSGFAFYLSYDSDVFRVLEPSGLRTGDSVAEPFSPGEWLDGVVLLNRAEEEQGVTFLTYAEASGVQRATATGSGVAATFIVEAMKRPLGDRTSLSIEERGHDRDSYYVTSDRPGEEQLFAHPLGSASLRVTGFRVQSLPDVQVVEGDGPQVVYDDLDAFVDQEGASVIWTSSFVNGLDTAIDSDGRVTMNPEGIFGDTTVVFTAFEVNEGNADADTVDVRILARPRITGLPPTITFAEDESSVPVDLDDFVTDLDSADEDLLWTPTNGSFVHVDIDPSTRLAVFSADPDSSGSSDIRLVVADATGLTDSVTISVIVTPVNDPPVVQRRAPVYPRLGAGGSVIIPLAELIEDPDDRPESLQILLQTEGPLTAQLTADGQNLELTGSTTGRGLVRITARDGSGEVSTGRLIAVVLPEGTTQAPQMSPLPLLRFAEGTPGTLDLNNLVDDDSPADQLTWTAASFDELRPIVSNGVLLVTAGAGFTGPAAVGLIVTDPEGNQDSGSLAVEVVAAGAPQAPQIFAPAKIGLASGVTLAGAPTQVNLNLDAMVHDPDDNDDDITWSVTASFGLLAEFDAATRSVRLSAAAGMNEVASLTLTATDDDGLSETVSIPVLVVEPGSAPLIHELADVVLDSAAAVGRIDLDDFAFDDEDFESELEWSAEGEPGIEVELDPVTHLLRVRRDKDTAAQPPSEARVVLSARDTRGQETSAILTVSLPPVFLLAPIPDVVMYAGSTDTSLVLQSFITGASGQSLQWSAAPTTQLAVSIDDASSRVRVTSLNAAFVGSEVVVFTATDATGRSRSAPVRVRVRNRGLSPQVRTFPVLSIRAGEQDRSLDLDDFVVDDDPDSTLSWSVSPPLDVIMSVDPLTHELTVMPQSLAAGPRTAQLLVRDPAGNSALALLEMRILRGGEPPVLGVLPQILLPAGGEEQALSLDLFVQDADTPDADIIWTVSAEPGVAARIENRRLFLSIPAGQQGARQVVLTAEDPQGNKDEGTLVILIQQDDEPPAFAVQASRNEVVADLLDVTIRPTEALNGPPQVVINGAVAEVRDLGSNVFSASFPVPPVDAAQEAAVTITGQDRAGNQGQRRVEISLRRLSRTGGTVTSSDRLAAVNVPQANAAPGRLAVLYELTAPDHPAGVGEDPGQLFSLALANNEGLQAPVTLNLQAGSRAAAPGVGIERWNPATRMWDDVPTSADSTTGWLAAAVRSAGIFRIGEVAADSRRSATRLSNYPNPFDPAQVETNIEYEVTAGGAVQLGIYNILGQRVRLLVDDSFQEPGLWTSSWNGRDDSGRQLASGVYLYQLRQPGSTRVRQLLLLK